MFQPIDLYLVPFSIIWTGFVAFFFFGVGFGALTGQMQFQAVNAPFLLIPGFMLIMGAYFTVGRFIHDASIRARTRYALTDRRALILRGDNFTAIDLARVDAVHLRGGKNGGRGTIEFGSAQGWPGWGFRGFGGWTPSLGGQSRFLGVEKAQELFNQIEAVRAKAA
jgi:hypothetical protein